MLISLPQKRILESEQHSSDLYNVGFELDFDKTDFNVTRLKHSINLVIERHHPLRTLYPNNLPNLLDKWNLEVDEVQVNSFTETSKYINEAFLHTHFDIFKGDNALVKVIVFYIDSSILVYCLSHHIAFDGASVRVFNKDFNLFYISAIVEKLAYTYQDFCDWEIKYLSSNQYKRSVEWWEALNVSNFINDIHYKTMTDSKTSNVYVSVLSDKDLTDKWKQLLNTIGITPYNLFQSILAIVIQDMTKQSKVLLFGATENRPTVKSLETIGMFVNTIMYVYQKSRMGLDFLKQCKTHFYQVLTHSQVPLEHIYKLKPQIMTTYTKTSKHDILTESMLLDKKCPAKFDLHLDFFNSEHKIVIEWNFNDKKFDFEMIKNFEVEFCRLIKDV